MHNVHRAWRTVIGLAGTVVLAGCLASTALDPSAKPQARPADLLDGDDIQPSATSEALTLYYARLQNDLQAQDLMRTGGGGIDTPYRDTDLKRNFERIAFYNEYQNNGGLSPADDVPGRLRKWRAPVRIGVEFGARVPKDIQAQDLSNIRSYAGRLSRITGHPISVNNNNANFTVMIMSADDAEEASARTREILPSFQRGSVGFYNRLPRSIRCFVIAAGMENDYEYRVALAYIRSENTALQRLACIHEELAQGLGLANDSPRARPSIFNDDEEFALLTSHDEELLRTLYSPALKPGMALEEARPIFSRIFANRSGPS
ncbi:DUF2927 domain-containing protein [Roseovarius rhodophyticola]|uniref:DUF2927 domain-containing protein n=1 Tax=Roseovarius rhodophyticola TaxID=3080827 RepID=A0ABZ2TBM1_9RHOB|nr:DUF2927 domain-containing protein [Roseovarius sp. W115]MDV2930795.1 DUF2927 domain-containing protein [Roseovarius sp. W115]